METIDPKKFTDEELKAIMIWQEKGAHSFQKLANGDVIFVFNGKIGKLEFVDVPTDKKDFL